MKKNKTFENIPKRWEKEQKKGERNLRRRHEHARIFVNPSLFHLSNYQLSSFSLLLLIFNFVLVSGDLSSHSSIVLLSFFCLFCLSFQEHLKLFLWLLLSSFFFSFSSLPSTACCCSFFFLSVCYCIQFLASH